MDYETINVVQECCEHFATQLELDKVICVINSASRCKKYNKRVGGADNSQHLKSRAIDFRILGVPPSAVYDYLVDKYPNKYGIGGYSTFTHIDTRSNGPARWYA